MDAHSSTVEVCDGAQAEPLADEVFAVYDAVFGDHPDLAEWRAELYDKHAGRDGFRLALARDDDRLVGFAWGYVGRRGQYWSDWVVRELPAEVTQAGSAATSSSSSSPCWRTVGGTDSADGFMTRSLTAYRVTGRC